MTRLNFVLRPIVFASARQGTHALPAEPDGAFWPAGQLRRPTARAASGGGYRQRSNSAIYSKGMLITHSMPTPYNLADMAHVFICYSSRDQVVADDVVAFLEARRVKCWISSRDVPPGQNYQEVIVG